MLIDSHAHLGYDSLYNQIELVLERASCAGITKIVNICTDEKTGLRGLEIQKKYPWVFNVGSTTPHDTLEKGESDFEFFSTLAKNKKLVAIGETGLDYFYDYAPKKIQIEFLSRYLELAIQTNLPVVIHCREAFEDLFSITDALYKQKPLLLHCFTGTKEEAKKALDRGWKISISGIVTFKKSLYLQEVAEYLPVESMLVETDSPYLSPQSKRGQSNEPSYVVEVAEFLSRLKQIDFIKFCEKTSSNAQEFFKI